MATTITGKNFDLTPAIKDYVNEKTQTLFKHDERITAIDVEVDKNMHHNKGDVFHVRINVQVPGHVLHAEETQPDLYAAIDIVRDEIDRQLLKNKEKYQARKRKNQRIRRSFKSIAWFWKSSDDETTK